MGTEAGVDPEFAKEVTLTRNILQEIEIYSPNQNNLDLNKDFSQEFDTIIAGYPSSKNKKRIIILFIFIHLLADTPHEGVIQSDHADITLRVTTIRQLTVGVRKYDF